MNNNELLDKMNWKIENIENRFEVLNDELHSCEGQIQHLAREIVKTKTDVLDYINYYLERLKEDIENDK